MSLSMPRLRPMTILFASSSKDAQAIKLTAYINPNRSILTVESHVPEHRCSLSDEGLRAEKRLHGVENVFETGFLAYFPSPHL